MKNQPLELKINYLMPNYHYEKRGVLQFALQLSFWVTLNISNSPYLYVVNIIKQVAKLQKLQLIVYAM
jgi:hypothetical protein